MQIKIDGIGTSNRGAQLMLFSVVDRLKNQYHEVTFILGKYRFDSLEKLREDYNKVFLQSSFISKIIRKVCKIFKIDRRLINLFFLEKQIDVLIDIGGYQFGDPWNHSEKDIAWINRYYSRLKKHETKIILLPQAFGPFKTENSIRMITTVEKYADAVFPRDDLSLNNLNLVLHSKLNQKVYPDFTNLLANDFNTKVYGNEKICFIPNKKMISSGKISENEYVSFLGRLIAHIKENYENEVILLNHEGREDLMLCEKINLFFDNNLTIHNGLDAFEIKKLLTECFVVISSRYHGIIGSLNQCVPCLATSWSHKYYELLKEYGKTEWLLNLDDIAKSIGVLNYLLDKGNNMKSRKGLMVQNINLNRRTEEMWGKVLNIIGNK